MDIMTLSLNQRIKILRERAGLNQKEFAERCNVSPATACNWENGKIKPTINSRLQIARVLKVDSEILLERE
jgi:transcriptional regulator with XRE-family HTH domain